MRTSFTTECDNGVRRILVSFSNYPSSSCLVLVVWFAKKDVHGRFRQEGRIANGREIPARGKDRKFFRRRGNDCKFGKILSAG